MVPKIWKTKLNVIYAIFISNILFASWIRFPMDSFGFFIEIILPPAIWTWGRLSL
jgi:hypothetical protein